MIMDVDESWVDELLKYVTNLNNERQIRSRNFKRSKLIAVIFEAEQRMRFRLRRNFSLNYNS